MAMPRSRIGPPSAAVSVGWQRSWPAAAAATDRMPFRTTATLSLLPDDINAESEEQMMMLSR